MGLNPFEESDKAVKLKQKILNDNFNGGSPYYGMYWCGYYGVELDDCIAKCQRNGILLRPKDIRSYREGIANRGMGTIVKTQCTPRTDPVKPFEEMKLEDFPKLPAGWKPLERRFFPCTMDNKPMQKWGWTRTFKPELFPMADAKALSPCGWVGQNMLYQNFIVFDIDGRGHGVNDDMVIEFGNMFKDSTLTYEDPSKPGSFHLYFKTNRLIPVRHFPWAKLDLMGNAVNAAVYFKNKKSNGLPMMELNGEIWQALINYQQMRKD